MEERFNFTAGTKKNLLYLFVGGIILSLLGIYMIMNSGHGHEEAVHTSATSSHSEFHWYQRVYSNLWINSLYFIGISVSAIFFVAIQYSAQAGWSAGLIRVPMAIGRWLPVGGFLMFVIFIIANHDIFHWTHEYLYNPEDPRYDYIIAGKEAYLNLPFYLTRMIGFIVIWYLLYSLILKHTKIEDEIGGEVSWRKMFTISTIFVVFYAFSSSVAAWDWVLSIDTHWFSTMIGWYVFASWWVSSLAFITYMVILLKDNGYLKFINHSVIHDLGKFVLASRKFLKKPSKKIFKKPIPKRNMKNIDKIVTVQFKFKQRSDDIIWGQIKRASNALNTHLELDGFTVLRNSSAKDEKENGALIFLLQTKKIEESFVRTGPNISSEDHCEKFISANFSS